LLPQLLVGGRLQAMTYKMPLYRRAAYARSFTWLLITIIVFCSALLPSSVALGLLVVFYMIFNIGGGTSALAFQDIVAKVIPPQRRGSFFGTRQLITGLLTVVIAGPLVRWLLDDAGPLSFPFNFGVLVLFSLLLYSVSLFAFTMVVEPPQLRLGVRMKVIEGLRMAPRLLRENKNYRWFIVGRILMRVSQIAEPFYLIYATEVLGLSASVAGVYLSLRAIAGALSNLVWGRISARRGNRMLLLTSGILLVLTPAFALIGPWVVQMLNLNSLAMMMAIGVVFLLSGAATDGSNIANTTYLLEIVPEMERPTYMALANTMLGIVTFLPVLGGWLIALMGYEGSFVLGTVFGLLGLFASFQLGEPNKAFNAPPRD